MEDHLRLTGKVVIKVEEVLENLAQNHLKSRTCFSKKLMNKWKNSKNKLLNLNKI